MFDYRPILFVIGVLLATFGGSMALPALADIFAGSPDWKVFLLSAGTTFLLALRWPLRTAAPATH